MEGLLVLKEETVATSLAGLVCDPSAFIVEEYSEEVGTSPLFFFEWSNMILPGWWFQRRRWHEHCPRGLHRPWAKYDHVWGGFSTQYKTRNHGNVFCLQNKRILWFQVREVDSSSDPMFPGGDCPAGQVWFLFLDKIKINKKINNSQSNCPAKQELVLHTLEQIPEDERFEAK